MPGPRLIRLAGPMIQRAMRLRNVAANAMTLGVRGMVLDGEARVFLVRHGYTPGWHMPGGAVDAGEDVHTALVRELAEEGNILVRGPATLHAIYRNPRYPRDHVALYVVRAFEQTAPFVANREIVETGFFPLAALPEATTPATRRRLAEVIDGAPPGVDW